MDIYDVLKLSFNVILRNYIVLWRMFNSMLNRSMLNQ